MNIKRTPDEFFITWRMWVVIFATAFGIYIGGVTSGYMIANARHEATQIKDFKAVDKKLDQLPAKTAEAVKRDDFQ
ncbi:hypothetical protein BTJ39_22350 [Izhakiella australiensis]|uniref:Uncharacterized protein n=1 Tax=Izhakiella australiensis TaxID=1926881 RepID=A0A1S8Y986_9GAMM|nr:hypothetical protein [Izhakiella australiensis]OON35620.1 hypothetical protein BTJ39_22350 [Izhakiella australiensis]